MFTKTITMAPCLAAVLLASTADAGTEVSVRIENLQENGGFFLTPFWVGVHNGGFDSYDGGTLASMWPGLTELAETGDTAPITAAFAASPAGVAGGMDTTGVAIAFDGDAPVLDPQEVVEFTLDAGDPAVNRYFSYASMIIPSNDLFVANGNPFAHVVFDDDGTFLGPVVIDIMGSGVNDNGSEVNNAFGGAAFSANGGVDADEKVVIRNFFTDDDDANYLASFLRTFTVTGFEITETFAPATPIARITIDVVPPCPWDQSGDGNVGPEDLARLLDAWGEGGDPAFDFDKDGTVGPADLSSLLTNWGSCP